jgi:predicted Zn-dependent protease with MMP-like domain
MAGILEWNRAFERLGFKDAVQAKIQPDDADWVTVDARHASVRWMTTARPAFGGIGPSQVDPRTGEILDADIGIDPTRLRQRRIQHVEQIPQPIAPLGRNAAMVCQIDDFAAAEMGFALDLLEARGEIEPDSPEAEAFVLEDLKDVVMHEVGHTLGLRHNFRASTVYTPAQLADPGFTKANGISGSVMEYNAINIALKGERQGAYGMGTLGPYDYWAIEYGYKPIAPDQEAEELKRIAARNTETLLAYSTDEDVAAAIDPDASMGDLSDDPLDFVSRRVTLARELLDRWQDRQLKPGDSYSVLRRNIGRGLSQVGASSLIAARYVGGLTVVRDHAGSPRPPLYPISPQRQRDALALLAAGLFSFDSFRFKPEFMQRLTQDYLDRGDSYDAGLSTSGIDYSLPTQVLAIQRNVLNVLMSDAVAQRILDSQSKLERPDQAFRLAELYGGLQAAIWSELKSGKDIDLFRRNLQREHANRVALALVRPSGSMPADARSLLRAQAKLLRADLAAAATRKGYSEEARAHIGETLSTLDEALKAPLMRQGV